MVACLSTRFNALPAPVRAALPKTFEQWAKVQILPDGDTIRAAGMETRAEDGRDATFVRVRSSYSHAFTPSSASPSLSCQHGGVPLVCGTMDICISCTQLLLTIFLTVHPCF